MRILDDQTGATTWEWTPELRDDLAARFKNGLLLCIQNIQRRHAAEQPLTAAETAALTDELMDAVITLDECTWNCLVAAGTLQQLDDKDEASQVPRADRMPRLAASGGKPVVLTQTTLRQLQGKTLVLERIDEEGQAVVRDRSDYWATPADRVIVVAPHLPPPQEGGTAVTGTPSARKADDMTFELHHGEVGHAIQFLSALNRTGEMEFHFPRHTEFGHLFLDKGRCIHAEYRQATGVDGLALMLSEDAAKVRFLSAREPLAHTIDMTTAQLLLEAAVRADETLNF